MSGSPPLVRGRSWPVRLSSGRDPEVALRPLARSDATQWREARRRNVDWLSRWDATVPPGGSTRPTSYPALVRRMHGQARQGLTFPFAVDVDGVFGGQVTVNNVVRGSAQFASIGYWLDQRFAGRGVMPRGVAMVVDHCFGPLRLHRVEVAIRPENSNSLRVVEKLAIPEVGYAPRYLHIDGDWRDHRLYALTAEDVPEGLLTRYERSQG